nr:trypsin-like peptidase domain-containing protein [Chloroflexota bacterium]
MTVGLFLAASTLACAQFTGAATAPAVPVTVVVTATPDAPAPVIPAVAPLTDAGDASLVALYHQLDPAVVAIRVLDSQGDVGLGSGFVIDTDGHIVTNAHVVQGASEIEVDFANGMKVHGEVLGTDATADLAVVRVNVPADQLTPVTLGDSDLVQVGERVVAIGNPFGLNGTMTIGIVSGLGRTLSAQATAPGGGSFSAPDIIQTDAAINPGNSGGPLINMRGEVIGVNKALVSDTGVNSGIGFAVASNTVRRIAPALIKDGKFVYPYLGITSTDELSLADVEALQLPRSTGVYVTSVTAGGPAEKAGLRVGTQPTSITGLLAGGDLIIAIDGRPVNVFADLLSYLVNHASVGQTVKITVLRDGAQQDIDLTLGARP